MKVPQREKTLKKMKACPYLLRQGMRVEVLERGKGMMRWRRPTWGKDAPTPQLQIFFIYVYFFFFIVPPLKAQFF